VAFLLYKCLIKPKMTALCLQYCHCILSRRETEHSDLNLFLLG